MFSFLKGAPVARLSTNYHLHYFPKRLYIVDRSTKVKIRQLQLRAIIPQCEGGSLSYDQ